MRRPCPFLSLAPSPHSAPPPPPPSAHPAIPPVQLLAALVRIVLSSESMQSELHQRVDALAAAPRAKDFGPGDEDSDGETPYYPPAPVQWHQQAAAATSAEATPAVSGQAGAPSSSGLAGEAAIGSEAPAGSAATGPSLELQAQPPISEAWAPPPGGGAVTAADWADWLQQRRMGLRRPLGGDLRGRRYW